MKCCDKLHESASAELYTQSEEHIHWWFFHLRTNRWPQVQRNARAPHPLYSHVVYPQDSISVLPSRVSDRNIASDCSVPHRQTYTARTRSSAHRRGFIILLEVSSPEIIAFCSRVSPWLRHTGVCSNILNSIQQVDVCDTAISISSRMKKRWKLPFSLPKSKYIYMRGVCFLVAKIGIQLQQVGCDPSSIISGSKISVGVLRCCSGGVVVSYALANNMMTSFFVFFLYLSLIDWTMLYIYHGRTQCIEHSMAKRRRKTNKKTSSKRMKYNASICNT